MSWGTLHIYVSGGYEGVKLSNTIKMGLLAVVVVIASLLIGFIIGAIDGETAQNSGTKSILVIGVATLAFIAIGVIAGSGKKSDKE